MRTMTRLLYSLIITGLTATIAVGTSGCGKREEAAGISIETRDDGVVVVHNPDHGLWRAGDAWEIEEIVRIGEVEGDEPYVFERIRDVHIDADGRIFILDGRAKQIRIFDSSGIHIRTVGRQGEGPREFQMPIGMAWSPDGNLWVVDVGINRFTVLTPDGDLLNTHHRERVGYSAEWRGTFDRDGALYEPGYSIESETGQSKQVYVRQILQNGRLVETGRYDLPDFDTPYYRVEHPGGSMNLAIPHTPEPSWVFDGIDGIWVAPGDQYTFRHQSLSGETTRIVNLAREPIPVSDAERTKAREDIEHALRRIAGGVDQIDFSKIPRHKPAYGPIILDDRGNIWVVQTLPESPSAGNAVPQTVFDVFDPDGRYLGSLAVNISLNPLPVIAARRIAGVITEESGLQRVVVSLIR